MLQPSDQPISDAPQLTRRNLLTATLLIATSSSCDARERPAKSLSSSPAPPTQSQPRLITQLGHSSAITSVAFSSDGRFVLTAGSEGTVRLWEAPTGKEVQVFNTEKGSRVTALFSPDSKRVVTLDGSSKVCIFDTETGQKLRQILVADVVQGIAVSPDGKRLATVGASAQLFDLASGSKIRRFQKDKRLYQAVAFSPSGRHLLTAGDDHIARLYDVGTGQEIRRFKGHEYAIHVAGFSPDGRTVITASEDDTVRLWNAATGKEIRRFKRPDAQSACFSPDGKRVLVSGGRTSVFEVTGKQLAGMEIEEVGLRSAAYSPDGSLVLVAGMKLVWLCDAATRQVIRRFEGRGATAQVAAFSPDGQAIITGHYNVVRWNLASGTITPFGEFFQFGIFSPDGRRFFAQPLLFSALIVDGTTGEKISELKDPGEESTSAAFSPDGNQVLMVGRDGVPLLSEVSTGRELRRFTSSDDLLITSVALSSDGQRALTTEYIRDIKIWNVSTGQIIKNFRLASGHLTSAAFSPDNARILVAGDMEAVFLLDAENGKEIRRFVGHGRDNSSLSSKVLSAVFSRDGALVLTAGADGTARLFDTATGREIHRFVGHQGYVVRAVFSPDNKRVLTASEDGTSRLWDVATGAEMASLVVFEDGRWAMVAPDGRFDCPDLESVDGLHWIVPGEPLRALPLEIFQRQYYEPGLLKRLWNGEKLPALPSLASLNRIQPRVSVADARRQADGTVTVTIDVASVTQRGKVSGAFDLRLFRDGQLVAWEEGVLKDGKRTFQGIRLPGGAATAVRFSAYAFNEHQVKSDTAHRELRSPPRAIMPPATRRAFILCMGVDASEGEGLSLRFAVNDANAIADVMTKRLLGTGRYAEVSAIRLVAPSDARNVDAVTATKADLRAVVSRLAGVPLTPADRARFLRIPGADRLRTATPDDLVLLSFSGHGYAGENGVFHLLPYDVGAGDEMTAQRLSRCISSDELSLWFRGVDAGDIVLIVDACHSATAIEGDGTFKAGPMGSRGLGQLAYDKRMLLLAATQASNVALESGTLGHGLLTYALVKDGIEGEKAIASTGGNQLTLSSWLGYGVKRVPELWETIRTGQGKLAKGVAPEVEPSIVAGKRRDLQQPILFDFSKKAGTDRDPTL